VTLARLLRRWAHHRSILILLVSFTAVIASGAASAGPKSFSVGATCSGGGQLCNNIDTIPLNITAAGGVGEGEFISSSPFACSDVRIHFLVDGTEVAVTGFVGPGGSTGFVSLGFIGHGQHTIGVRAEGEVGGCNVGALISWAGTVKLMKAP
jgi:hypothetical protein